MFSAGFIHKTVKEDLIIIFNHVYPWWKQLKKIPEDTRRLSTEHPLLHNGALVPVQKDL
jgi:predicted phage-related endonuclease